MNDLLLEISECLQDPRPSVLCIVTKNNGSVPGKVGAKMVVYSDGKIKGTVGGGGIEKKTIADALECLRSGVPVLKEYNLKTDLGMTCGGEVGIYYEPLVKPAKLYIFGAGHIGKEVAKYAAGFMFETFLIDWREEMFTPSISDSYKQICLPYLEAVEKISFDPDSYIVIVTPNHEMDEEILAAVGKLKVAYIGLIGSKRKIATLKDRFLKEDLLTSEELERVDMPIGIRFKAITPAEIAISILAKLIDVKNERCGR
jgi:xanthine dehydrogenase accessory factor